MKTQLKSLLYLIPISLSFWPPLILAAIFYWQLNGHLLLFVPVFLFVITPILDQIWGNDPQTEPIIEKNSLAHWYFRGLPLLCVPSYCLLICTTPVVINLEDLAPIHKFEYLFAVGILGGVIAINVAHELVHRTSLFERSCGGILLSTVTYAGFKVEHIRHHHVYVATPLDPASSYRNQNLYHFVFQGLFKNPVNAFSIEAQRLRKKNLPVWSYHNELIGWYFLSLLICLIYGFISGWLGILAFISQSFIAAGLLESVNYIEHYGLRRKQKDDSRWEKVKPCHSWNSNIYWSSIYLFQLPRHSDHHEIASKHYFNLQLKQNAPQLPHSYPSMVLLAYFPPLWYRIMNPRLDDYFSNNDSETVTTE